MLSDKAARRGKESRKARIYWTRLPTLDPVPVAPILLKKVNLTRPVSRRFDLGMTDFVDSDAFEETAQGTSAVGCDLRVTI